MKSLRVSSLAVLALAALILPAYAQNSAPAAQAAQPAPVCANQPNCTENSRFAVQVTDFRTSAGQFNWKVIDVTLHFINKTTQPLILGYSDGTGMALDDQGNRYNIVNTPNGVRGIGIVRGPSGDPKFELDPNDSGDAMFELGWPTPPNSAVGETFELDLTVREMNTLAGGAHTLGREFPLRFQGLQNGVASSAGGAAGGQAAGGQVAGGGGQASGAMPATAGNATPQAGGGMTSGGGTSAPAPATGTAPAKGGFLSRLQQGAGMAQSGNTSTQAATGGTAPASANAGSTSSSTTNKSGGLLSRLQGMAQGQGMQIPGVGATGCPANQHCTSAGPFTAEAQLAAGGLNANVSLTLRNGTNQPAFVACKGNTGQLRDNAGHVLSMLRDPCASARPVRLNPGQAMPVNFAFHAAAGPLGNSFSYGVVIDQFQVLQNGQAQLVREYPVNIGGLAVPGAATTNRSAVTPTRH